MADGQPGDWPERMLFPESRQMALNWVTIWQSELAALAADREAQESWVASVAAWAEASQAMLGVWSSRHDTRADAPAGTAPPVAASDDRDDAIGRLAERVAALERRLAGHDGGA